jgi:hypothetical protein
MVGRPWTSSGIRSSHPELCNCFRLQIPGHPIARVQNIFPTIDDLRQILLNQYTRIGLERGYIETLRPDHPYRTVKEGSSWEGGGPIQLPCIPLDSTIANNYRRYRNSAGIATDSVRNPPRPAKRSRIHSYSDSLSGEDSELSESSEDIKLALIAVQNNCHGQLLRQ